MDAFLFLLPVFILLILLSSTRFAPFWRHELPWFNIWSPYLPCGVGQRLKTSSRQFPKTKHSAASYGARIPSSAEGHTVPRAVPAGPNLSAEEPPCRDPKRRPCSSLSSPVPVIYGSQMEAADDPLPQKNEEGTLRGVAEQPGSTRLQWPLGILPGQMSGLSCSNAFEEPAVAHTSPQEHPTSRQEGCVAICGITLGSLRFR
ncbi:hypothetical protein B0T22DRAFT_123183 [Podospora appendiculata]|uniref:Uncharacterized protein n=1 Tax=Podospora appendiculata TaxID=314037 RepID=A0AAE0X7J5_9PEZI|nr:hypothetical protein B0T22DRAFT_123183 [Podospora appendiculata]